MAFALKSPAFDNEQVIDAKYTGDGGDVSPPLEWSDPPAGTRSFMIVVEDPDAPNGTFRHWGLYNIPANFTALPEGVGEASDIGVPGVNDFGSDSYRGPAPPHGHGPHHYHFKLAALDVDALPVASETGVAELQQAAEGHVLGEAELICIYER